MEDSYQTGGMPAYGGSSSAGKQEDSSGHPPQHGNLFVKGLPPDLDETGLTMMFQNFGIVETSRIIRHGRTMVSKGYGFVKFSEPTQATAAIEAVNGQQLGATTLEVKYADADAGRGQGRTPSDNLYIRGLPASWTNDDLANLFAAYGGVAECRMLHPRWPPNGEPSTQTAGGLVRLSSVEAASAAIAALNERPSLTGPGGPPLLVRFADTPEEKQRKAARKQRFAGDPYRAGAAAGMPAGFTAFGADSPDGQQAFQQPGSATYAGGYGYDGRPGYGYPAYGSRSTQSASLYIKNLPPEADKLFLYEHFAPLGAILSVRLLTDDSGACRGVGFVNYADPCSASQAAASLNGARMGEKPLHVSIQPLKQRPPRAAAGLPASMQ